MLSLRGGGGGGCCKKKNSQRAWCLFRFCNKKKIKNIEKYCKQPIFLFLNIIEMAPDEAHGGVYI
jgi:hypothetical protein